LRALQQKITFAEMRSSGVRGILIYCADYTRDQRGPMVTHRP
jgi:hypothetical protein